VPLDDFCIATDLSASENRVATVCSSLLALFAGIAIAYCIMFGICNIDLGQNYFKGKVSISS
jgi:hypothetical protein